MIGGIQGVMILDDKMFHSVSLNTQHVLCGVSVCGDVYKVGKAFTPHKGVLMHSIREAVA